MNTLAPLAPGIWLIASLRFVALALCACSDLCLRSHSPSHLLAVTMGVTGHHLMSRSIVWFSALVVMVFAAVDLTECHGRVFCFVMNSECRTRQCSRAIIDR